MISPLFFPHRTKLRPAEKREIFRLESPAGKNVSGLCSYFVLLEESNIPTQPKDYFEAAHCGVMSPHPAVSAKKWLDRMRGNFRLTSSPPSVIPSKDGIQEPNRLLVVELQLMQIWGSYF